MRSATKYFGVGVNTPGGWRIEKTKGLIPACLRVYI